MLVGMGKGEPSTDRFILSSECLFRVKCRTWGGGRDINTGDVQEFNSLKNLHNPHRRNPLSCYSSYRVPNIQNSATSPSRYFLCESKNTTNEFPRKLQKGLNFSV